MAFSWPASPTAGDTYTGPNGVIYTWDGVRWTGDMQGATGFVAKTGDTMTGALNLPPDNPGNTLITNPLNGADQAIDGLITLKGHYPQVGFDRLTLNVSPTGSATPADPIGDEAGSGDAFNTLGACLKFIKKRLSVDTLRINIAPATYNESPEVIFPQSVNNIELATTTAATFVGSSTQKAAFQVYCNYLVPVSGDLTFKSTSSGICFFAYSGSSFYAKNNVTTTFETVGPTAISIESGSFTLAVDAKAVVKSTGPEAIILSGYSTLSLITSNNTITFAGAAKKIYCTGLTCAIDYAPNTLVGLTEIHYKGAAVVPNTFYIKHPTTGLITQGANLTVSGGGDHTVNFPVAFPNKCFFCTTGSGSNNLTVCARNFSKTQLTLATNTGGYVNYIAYGN